MPAPDHGTHYEDFSVGDTYAFGSHTVDAEEIKRFGNRYDPQPFHVDETGASASIFGGRIASGWHTVAVCMKRFVEGMLADTASAGGRGVETLRWHRPVTPGTELSIEVELVEKQPAERFGGLAEVHLEVVGMNGAGDPVISFTLLGLVERREAG